MIIPGILETDFNQVKRKVALIENVAQVIQIDMADNELVDGITFQDINLLKNLQTKAEIELDLMEMHPVDLLKEKIPNVTRIVFHIESADDLLEDILKAKNHGYKVGFAINPSTPIEKLDPYVEYLDYVQFMTVIPGGQGRTFENSVLDNIAAFKQQHPNITIQVDGGINVENLKKVKQKGVENVIIGSQIFNNDNAIAALDKFKELEKEF